MEDVFIILALIIVAALVAHCQKIEGDMCYVLSSVWFSKEVELVCDIAVLMLITIPMSMFKDVKW